MDSTVQRPAPESGRRIADRYEIIRVIGSGGFGVVYEARDTRLDRVVAIKTLHASRGAGDASRQRFLREAKATARLHHENAVSLHDVGEDGRELFLVLEYVDGDSLRDILAEGRPSLAATRQIIVSIARALHAAHRLGIVHRDIKPANVIIRREDGRVKVADFGVARLAGDADLTVEGGVVGTPRYMAPEQLLGQEATAQSDLFSLGCLAYELLTGAPPFTGETTTELLAQVKRKSPPRLPEHLADSDLAAVVHQLLQTDPADRPGSAEEVVRELADVDRATAAPKRRVATWKIAAATVMAIAVTVAVVFLFTSLRDPTSGDAAVVERSIDVKNAGLVEAMAARTCVPPAGRNNPLVKPPLTRQSGRVPVRVAGLSFQVSQTGPKRVTIWSSGNESDAARQAVLLFDQLHGYRFGQEPNEFLDRRGTAAKTISIDVAGMQPHRLVELIATAAGWPVIVDSAADEVVRRKLHGSSADLRFRLSDQPWDGVAATIMDRYGLTYFPLERSALITSRERLAQIHSKIPLVVVQFPTNMSDLDSAGRVLSAVSSERGTVLVNRRLQSFVISDRPDVLRRQHEILTELDGSRTRPSATRTSYRGQSVDVNVSDIFIGDLIHVASDLTGLNIVTDPAVKGRVTGTLNDIPWDEAFELFLKASRNTFTFRGSIAEVIPESHVRDEDIVVETVKLRREDPQFFAAWRKGLSPKGSLTIDDKSRLLVIREFRSTATSLRALVERIDAQVSPEARRRMLVEIEQRGVDAGLALQKKLVGTNRDYDFGEDQWNDLGYSLMAANAMDKAIELFRWIVAEHPQSANAHDSLGEAYAKSGNTALAVQHYRRSLELDPENENAKRVLAELTKKLM